MYLSCTDPPEPSAAQPQSGGNGVELKRLLSPRRRENVVFEHLKYDLRVMQDMDMVRRRESRQAHSVASDMSLNSSTEREDTRCRGASTMQKGGLSCRSGQVCMWTIVENTTQSK